MDEQEKSKLQLAGLKDQLIQQIKEQGGPAAIDGEAAIRELTKIAYEAMLQGEMEAHLGYGKHDPDGRNSGNNRNGVTTKTIKGDFGQMDLATPRDRNGTFDPKVIKKRQTTMPSFADKIISLYTRGMTTTEIEEHLKEMYGVDASPAFISRVTDRVMEDVVAWQNRTLERLYTVIYMDGIRFPVRDNGRVQNKVVYVCLGVPIHGKQEVLGLWASESEGAAFWMSVCNDLKARGVDDILIACVDGLKGLPQAIEAVFPHVDVQLCVVHQIRNSMKFVREKDRKAFCKDLKNVYGAATIEAAELALKQVEEKWPQYPASLQSWKVNWQRLTAFFKYPVELRKIVYTTNSIESLHSQLRKNTRNRRVFPNDEALIKLLYLNIRNLTKKWKFRQNWDIVVNQLAIAFQDRIQIATSEISL